MVGSRVGCVTADCVVDGGAGLGVDVEADCPTVVTGLVSSVGAGYSTEVVGGVGAGCATVVAVEAFTSFWTARIASFISDPIRRNGLGGWGFWRTSNRSVRIICNRSLLDEAGMRLSLG